LVWLGRRSWLLDITVSVGDDVHDFEDPTPDGRVLSKFELVTSDSGYGRDNLVLRQVHGWRVLMVTCKEDT
jgi:hypothetical protein